MLTPRQAFKFGFLARCVEAGMEMDEIRKHAKEATDKLAVELPGEKLVSTMAGTVTGKLLDFASAAIVPTIALGAVAPPILGGVGGYGLARLTGVDEQDVENLKAREEVEAYRQEAENLRRLRTIRRYQQSRRAPGKILL